MNNGGIIGVANTPTIAVASGMWRINDAFLSTKSNTWPQPPAGGAVGGYSYFVGGGFWFTSTEKYTIATDAVTVGTAITTGGGFNGGVAQGAGAANGTTGIFTNALVESGADQVSGSLSGKIARLTLASETWSAGTTQTKGYRMRIGTGNEITAVFFNGYSTDNTGAAANSTSKYSYSGNSWSAGTAAGFGTANRVGQVCHSDGLIAYVAGGMNEQSGGTFSDSKKYAYSSDTVTTGGTAGSSIGGTPPGTGNQSVMIIMGGRGPTTSSNVNNVRKLTLLTDTFTEMTALGSNLTDGDAAGDDIVGIFQFSGTMATQKYTYSTDSRTSATAMASNRSSPAAFHSIQAS